MAEKIVNTKDLKEVSSTLSVGDRVLLSGTVYTARDAAHKRIKTLIDKG
ncbi:MAG: TRZ/ATZ family protein, partial [Clostridiales bacterium]|nr:TRZ/ATZ family protein [Clostridiales bacterium]